MKGTPGIAGRLFTALANAGINILTVAQGSSEYNISLVIAADEVPTAVQAVHATFGLGK
jgi:aspartokinase